MNNYNELHEKEPRSSMSIVKKPVRSKLEKIVLQLMTERAVLKNKASRLNKPTMAELKDIECAIMLTEISADDIMKMEKGWCL